MEIAFGYMIMALILGPVIWATYDAHTNRIPITDKPYSLNNGAVAWFLTLTMCAGIFMFPYYLVRRSRVLRERATATAKSERSSVQAVTAEDLKKMKELLDMGAISQEDFNLKKHEFLASPTQPSSPAKRL